MKQRKSVFLKSSNTTKYSEIINKHVLRTGKQQKAFSGKELKRNMRIKKKKNKQTRNCGVNDF